MNLQNVLPDVPGPVWDDLMALAAADWVDVYRDEAGLARFSLHTERVTDPAARRYAAAAANGEYEEYGGGLKGALWLYAVSRLIAEGPKVYRATAEQCEAAEHIDLDFPLTDYRQAYPTMLVEFPRAYLGSVAARLGPDAPRPPRYVIVRHWPAGPLFTGCSIRDRSGLDAELVYLFGGEAAYRSLEEALRVEHNPDPAECALNEMLTRVSINLMLLLARTTTTVVPSDPAGLGRARRNLARGSKADANRREVARHVHLVVPDREVVLRRVRRAGAAGVAGVADPRAGAATHWVRGHYRAYPGHAAARHRGEAVPLLFVAPYLVVGGDGGPPPAPVYTAPSPTPAAVEA